MPVNESSCPAVLPRGHLSRLPCKIMSLYRPNLALALAALLTASACEKTPSAPVREGGAPAALHTDAPDPGHVRAYIEKANAELVRHFVAGDADAAAALFTDDALLMLPGMEAVTGREGIRQVLAGTFQAVDFTDVRVQIREVSVHGDMAYEVGTTAISYTVGGQSVTDPGKYIVAWKRQPTGEWKIHRDISNTSR